MRQASRDRPLGSAPGLGRRAQVRVTPAGLWDLYYREELSYAGIGAHLGCSRAYVVKLMRKFGILPRSKKVALRVGRRHGRSTGPVPQPWTEERLKARSAANVASVKKWRAKNPEKARSQWRLNKAVQRGSVARPGECGQCGKECVPHGHHADYSRAFEVEWLCARCHGRAHREARLVELAGDRYVS